MKKFFFVLLLLGFGTVCAQEIKPNTPEYYAKCFENLFYRGFVLGFGESEYDIDAYFDFATRHVQTTPAEILHQTFLNALPEIDPLGLHKRVHSAEEYLDLTIGEQREFSIGFFFGGYVAAMRAAGLEYLLTQEKCTQIHEFCQFFYENMVAGAIKEAPKKQ